MGRLFLCVLSCFFALQAFAFHKVSDEDTVGVYNGFVEPHPFEEKAALLPTQVIDTEVNYDSSISVHKIQSESGMGVDKNCAPGIDDSNSGVDDKGNFCVTIPLRVISNLAGPTPALSLSYNSARTDGLLGTGWTLAGISEITVTRRTAYHDGAFGSGAAYMLDGHRLTEKSTSGGITEFCADNGYEKILGYGDAGKINRFMVFGTDGSTACYEACGNSYYIVWTKDIYGRTVTFSYIDKGTYRMISSICYENKNRRIDFTYSNLGKNTRTLYDRGLAMKIDLALSSIVARNGSDEVHTYNIAYENIWDKTAVSRIEHLQHGHLHNTYDFSYTGDSQNRAFSAMSQGVVNYSTSTFDASQSYFLPVAPYSGNDGNAVVVYPRKNPYYNNNKTDYDLRNEYTGEEEFKFFSPQFDVDENIHLRTGNILGKGFVTFLSADVSGTGAESIVKVNDNVAGANDSISFRLFNMTRNNKLSTSKTYSFLLPLFKNRLQPKTFLVGDFDGNGKKDEVLCALGNNRSYKEGSADTDSHFFLMNLSDGTHRELSGRFNYQYVPVFDNPKGPAEAFAPLSLTQGLYAADVDGDGCDEIIQVEFVSYISVYKVTNGKLCLMDTRRYDVDLNINNNVSNRLEFIGDFNGDGKTDILWTSKGDGVDRKKRHYPLGNRVEPWYIGFSKGDGTFDIKTVTTYPTYYSENFYMADINHDGKTDIVGYDSEKNTLVARVLRHVAGSADNGEEYSADVVATKLTDGTSVLLPFKGGINSASLLAVGNDKMTTIKYGQDMSCAGNLTRFCRSDGFVANAYYRFQTSPRNGYVVFPHVLQRHGRWIACGSDSHTGDGKKVSDQTYSFVSPVYRADGLGFMGYANVSVTDNMRGMSVDKTFDTKGWGTLMSVLSPQSTSSYEYNISAAPRKQTLISLAAVTENNLLTGNTTHTSYKYDNLGNTTEVETNYADGLGRRSSMTYRNETADRYVCVLTKREDCNMRNGVSSVKTTEYEYDGDLHNTVVKSYAGDELCRTETYRFADHRPIEKTTRLFGSKNTTTEGWQYDKDGLLASSTDKYDHATTFRYSGCDKPSVAIDYRNRETHYIYDQYDNLIKTEHADGTCEETELGYIDDGSGAMYKKTARATGKATVTEYYDGSFRLVRKSVQGADGRNLNTDYSYDILGRLKSETLPYKNEISVKKEYEYDDYDRLVESTDPLKGEMCSFYYDGNRRTVTRNLMTQVNEYDALGNIVVSDANGSSTGRVTYDYTPDGQVAAITDADGRARMREYDVFGRLTCAYDPSSGETRYMYDADGNLEESIDRNSNVTTYRHDEYGRLTQKTVDGMTARYYYNADGQLEYADCDNGGKSMEYDAYGRLVHVVCKTVGGYEDKTISYHDGNVSKVEHVLPEGTVTEDYTYANGTLTQISTNYDKPGQPSYRLAATDNGGNVSKITTGSLEKTFTYNSNNQCVGIKSVLGGSVTEQDLSYARDEYVNLIMRTDDNLNGTTERYDYDNMMRLTRYGDHDTEYSQNGNVSYMSRTGTLEYDENAENPYAIAALRVRGNSYPADRYQYRFNGQNRLTSVSGGGKTVSFEYDGDGNRVSCMSVLPQSGKTSKYYIGENYEATESDSGRVGWLYVGGSPYTAHSVLRMSGDSVRQYRIMRDVMGSITKVIDDNGNVVQDVSYDAWGNVRNPETLEYTVGDSTLFLGRGFTGHEHMPLLGLINMNARIYSAPLGRFISPDPVLDSSDGQTLNSYTYARNNPLMYTDPDGRFGMLAAFGIYSGFSYLKGAADNHSFNPFKWHTGSVMFTVGFEGMLSNDHPGFYGYMSTSFGNFGGGIYYGSNNQPNAYMIYQTNGGYDYGQAVSQYNALAVFQSTVQETSILDYMHDVNDRFCYVEDCISETKKFKRCVAGSSIYASIDGNEKFLKDADFLLDLPSNKYFTRLAKTNRLMDLLFDAYDVCSGMEQDNSCFGYNTQKTAANILVSNGISLFAMEQGAEYFGMLGFYIGGPYGAVCGAAIGAVGGAVLGDALSTKLVDESFNYIYGY